MFSKAKDSNYNMNNNFPEIPIYGMGLEEATPADLCRPLNISYSLGFYISRNEGLNCPTNHDDYLYQLSKSIGNKIDNARYLKTSINLEPCSTKTLDFSSLGFNSALYLFIKTECGIAYLSLGEEDYFFPTRLFFVDLGYTQCVTEGNQIIDLSKPSPLTSIKLRSSSKVEPTVVTVVIVGT